MSFCKSSGAAPGALDPFDRPRQEYPAYTSPPPERVNFDPSFTDVRVTRVVNSSSAAPGSTCISPTYFPFPGISADTSHRPAILGARIRALHADHSGVCSGADLPRKSTAASTGIAGGVEEAAATGGGFPPL